MNQSASPIKPFVFETNSVRTFTDENGNPWFCAKDVCDILGYANTSKAISDHCRSNGVITKDTPTESDVTNRYTSSKARKSQEMTFINEGNLYRLIVRSKKPEAEKFESWIFDEVVPSIRQTGSYSTASMSALSSHVVWANQVQNSKDVNKHCVHIGGKQAVIAYNIKNCTIQSGRTPSEWKKIGREEGMSTRTCGSAKEILRFKAPHIACGMSLSDELIAGGAKQDDGISIGKDSQSIFQRIIALGITPPELLL